VTELPPRPDTGGRSPSGRGVAVALLLVVLVVQVLFFLGYLFVLLVGGTTGLEFGVFLLLAVAVGAALLWLLIAIIRERVPPNRALLVLVVPLADALIVVLLTAGTLGGSCSEQERAIIDEIAPYPGVTTAFDYESSSGTCAVSFEVQASPDDVLSHYRRELERDGWRVAIEDIPAESEEGLVTAKDLQAQRGSDSFTIALESSSGTTSAAIRVNAG
jgi:hypothetical protein